MPDQATQDVAIIRLLLQSPQRHEPFSLKVSADARLVDVQRAISEQYDGHPHPSTQTLIYAGKVLKDTSVALRDVIKAPLEPGVTHSLHLVVRQESSSTARTAASAKLCEAAVPSSNVGCSGAGSSGDSGMIVAAAPRPTSAGAADSSSSSSSSGASGMVLPPDAMLPDTAATVLPVTPENAPAVISDTPDRPAIPLASAATAQAAAQAPPPPPLAPRALFEFSATAQNAAGGGVAPAPAPAPAPPAGLAASAALPHHCMMLNPLLGASPFLGSSSTIMAAAYQAAYTAARQSIMQAALPASAAVAPPAVSVPPAAACAPVSTTTPLTGNPWSSAAATSASGGSSSSTNTAAAGAPTCGPMGSPLAHLAPALLFYPAAYQQAAAAAAMAAAAAAAAQQAGQGLPVMATAAHLSAVHPALATAPLAALPFGLHPAVAAASAAAQQAAAASAAAAAGTASTSVAPGSSSGSSSGGGALNGLRQRMPQQPHHRLFLGRRPPAAAGGGGADAIVPAQQQQQQQQHGHADAVPPGVAAPPPRRYRTRTITLRISMRTLLQGLVFAIVLYQHCSWPRLCILLVGAAVLWATALWAPFRALLLSLAVPPGPEQLAAMQARRAAAAAAAAAGAPHAPLAPLQEGVGAAAVPAAAPVAADAAGAPGVPGAAVAGPVAPAAAAAGAAAAAPRDPAGAAMAGAGLQAPLAGVPLWLQHGVVREVLAVLVSFVTSLLPGWNHNAEDAAAFAAAQELVAREDAARGGGAGVA